MFDVEVVTPRLRLRTLTDRMIPQLLALIHAGVHPVGSETSSFPPTQITGLDLEQACAQFWWGARSNWKPDQWRLDMVVFGNDEPEVPLGVQSISADDFATERSISTMSWLARSNHRQGFGTEMRWAALAFAFDGLGATKVMSSAEPDNLASKGVSLACGYEPAGSETIEIHYRNAVSGCDPMSAEAQSSLASASWLSARASASAAALGCSVSPTSASRLASSASRSSNLRSRTASDSSLTPAS